MLHVLTKDGQKLFSGSRHDVKLWIRKNKIKNYVLKERFSEKVAVVEEDAPTNELSESEKSEFFNKIFDVLEEDDG